MPIAPRVIKSPCDTFSTPDTSGSKLMFPGLAIALGKVALVVILLRTVLRRSWNELVVPLPLLLMAAVQYVYFKQGADVHIFWPHYFAPYFALSVGSLAAGVRAAATVLGPRLVVWMENRRVADRTVRRVSAGLPWSGLIVLAIPLALIWRDGASMVRLARETGGRFNSTAIQSDIDKAVAMRWYLQRYPTVLQFGFHPGMVAQWALAWETDNRVIVRGASVGTKAAHASRLYMLDTATTTVANLRQALESFKVTAVGTYWFLDRDAPPQLEGFSLRRARTDPVGLVLAGRHGADSYRRARIPGSPGNGATSWVSPVLPRLPSPVLSGTPIAFASRTTPP